MIFNEEQWKIIKKASPHYDTARRDYIRNAPRWLTDEIIKAYEEATGKTVQNKNSNCSSCILRIYQMIGKDYFKDLAERKKIEIENEKGNDTKGNAETDNGNKKKKKRSSRKVQKGFVEEKDS